MLWYKGWLETRLRLLLSLAMAGFLIHAMQSSMDSARLILQPIQSTVPTFVMAFCALLAGAGIATQPPFQATKDLHGSTLFTLSLPVSRIRLIAVRAVLGWLEVVGVIGVFLGAIWFLSPGLRTIATPLEMVQFMIAIVVCASSIYGLSVLLATFLDDQWRIWGTMLATVGLGWLLHHLSLPASTDIFLAMSKGSPLFTHTMPWAAMALAVTFAAGFLYAALKVAQAREY